jgi:hypothetical protein
VCTFCVDLCVVTREKVVGREDDQIDDVIASSRTVHESAQALMRELSSSYDERFMAAVAADLLKTVEDDAADAQGYFD